MVGINIEVDDEMHKQFKAHCALIEKDIKKFLPNWMRTKVNEHG